jgi:hypothetical protein
MLKDYKNDCGWKKWDDIESMQCVREQGADERTCNFCPKNKNKEAWLIPIPEGI